MAQQTINIGASPNDGTGTPLRTAFQSTNSNFTELYTALGGGVGLPGATTQVIFNDGGTNLAGDAGLVYNKTTDALTVAGLVTAGSAAISGAATVGTTLGVTGASTLTGSVGIGAASSAKLSVIDTNGIPIRFGDLAAAPASQTACFVGVSTSAFSGNGNGDLILVPRTSDNRDVVIYTGSGTAAERLRVTAAGNVNITTGNVVMATSGKGIDFAATASGSGTMTSELLNDYEEGTWTGTLKGATTDPTTAVTATGRYTKVGRQVSVQIAFEDVNTLGASGGVYIAGLPFTNNPIRAAGSVITFQGVFFTETLAAIIGQSDTVISLFSVKSGTGYTPATHNPTASGVFIWANVTYTV